MGTISNIEIIKIFKEKSLSLFTITDFARLFKINNQNSAYKKIQRLEKQGIIKKIIKGKYVFLLDKPDDFTLANFLYPPSYVSLESALSFYSIISGFPYQITSISLKKPKRIDFDGQEFVYSQIVKELFWGYEKKDRFLIAEKEKALLDLIYFEAKGLRKIDFAELDFSQVNKEKLITYLKRYFPQKWLKLKGKLSL